MGLFRKERKRIIQILFSVILAHLSFFPFCCAGREAGKEGERKREVKLKGIKPLEIQAWPFVMNEKSKKGKPFAHAPYKSCSGKCNN